MPHIFSSERPVQRRGRSAGGNRAEAGPDLGSLQTAADTSTTQRKLSGLQDMAVQRMEDEEMLQGKSKTGGLEAPVQMMEDEEMLQGKAAGGGLAAPAMQRQSAEPVANGGLPGTLRSGVETLSGMDMSDVRVHYNSGMPAELNAHAFAQGTDIHLASGQEKHLGHEAWHVVQQKQGRVNPTMELGGVGINDDAGLEQEADRMGAKALQTKPEGRR